MLKAIYLPFRRIWLEDDERLQDFEDYRWAIFMPTFTILVLLICISATWTN